MGDKAAADLTLEGLIHDLNNVFQSVSEVADLLEKDPKWHDVAGTLQRSVRQGCRIVDSLLGGARQPQDLETILDNSIVFASDLFRALHAPPVKFERTVEPGLRLCGAGAAWERVLLNLFLNAAQAMKNGGVIEISARRCGDAIEISVEDSGPGIPPEILPRIFEPHFSTKSSSSGLGLHIVKSVVTAGGGTISVENRRESSGAKFTIRLPEG